MAEFLTFRYTLKMQWCKLVRPGSGYKVFFNTETQNYAVKENHLFVFDDVQSLKEKVSKCCFKIDFHNQLQQHLA
jgi:hypothetical protein